MAIDLGIVPPMVCGVIINMNVRFSLSAYSDLALFIISDGLSPYNRVSTALYFAFQSTICVIPFSVQVKVRGE